MMQKVVWSVGCFIGECKIIQSGHYKVPRDHTYWQTYTKTRAQKWLGVANFEGLFPLISTPSQLSNSLDTVGNLTGYLDFTS